MKKKYKHLDLKEREEISLLFAQGVSFGDIGRKIGRDKATISREISRNGPIINKGYYRAHKAQERAEVRNSITHTRYRLKDTVIKKYVIKKLNEGWSPEIISGRIYKDLPGKTIGYEAIYQYIYLDNPFLIKCLTRKHKRRKSKGQSKKHAKSHIAQRISIDKRASKINNRKRFGDWEADTIVSRQSKAAVCALIERKSRKLILEKLTRKTAENMSIATVSSLIRLPKKLRRTITYDNGSENTHHVATNKQLGTSSFSCSPYHSWEKGSVENAIGIVRRYLPKKTDFSKISAKDLKFVEESINNRPKKCLNYFTPNEVFARCCTC